MTVLDYWASLLAQGHLNLSSQKTKALNVPFLDTRVQNRWSAWMTLKYFG